MNLCNYSVLLLIVLSGYFSFSAEKIDLKTCDSLENILKDTIKSGQLPPVQRIDIFLELSKNYLSVSPEKALLFCRQAFFLSKQINSSDQTIIACQYLGKIYSLLGNHNASIEYFREAITYSRESDDKENIVILKDEISKEYILKGQYAVALENLYSAQEIAAETGNDELCARIFNNLGVLYCNLKNYDKSLQFLNRALTIYTLINNKQAIANTMTNMGNVFRQSGNLEIALQYTQQAIDIYKKIENIEGQAIAYNSAGQLYKQWKKYNLAEEFYYNSLVLKKKLGIQSAIVMSLISFAELNIETHQYRKAGQYLEQALNMALKENLTREIITIYYYYAELYNSINDYKKAFDSYKLYNTYKDSVYNEENSRRIIELQTSYEILEKEKENELLRNSNRLKELQIAREQNLRNIILLIMILILFVLFYIYNRFRIKKKASEELSTKNEEIARINKDLQTLNDQLEEIVEIRTQELVKEIDIRKQTEKELISAKEKAEEANILKNNFLANISHEIRTPMNGIIGFIDLLKDENLTPGQQNEYMEIISNSSNYLLTIINDLIDISKIEAGQLSIRKEAFSLNKLLDNLLIFYKSKIEFLKKQVIVFCYYHLPEKESILISDSVRLRQVLTNLLDNALKFTEKGEITFGYEKLNENSLQFFINDTGAGINSDDKSKVFERFWQVNSSASRKFGGTGLGLAISKGLIELMGGTIALESELNKGTRFTFTIPYLTGLISTTDKQISISPEKYDWGGKVLLLAEDDKVSIKYFENILKPTNIQLIISENGLDAINICNQKKVDIVLMDVQLPEIDGYTAVRQIKTAHPDIIIIAETANAMQEDREKCLAAGFDDYIAKPIRKKDLLEIIGKYFA